MARKMEMADQIDKHVGLRIKQLRQNLGFSQGELAKALGVTYQQAHKYENGSNRISAGRLAIIAMTLNVPVNFFYEGYGNVAMTETPDDQQRLYLEAARAFRNIKNPKHQEAVYQVIRSLAE